MLLMELFSEDDISESAVMAWGKSGSKVVKKYRCMSGAKKGRLVKSPGDCSRRVDPKKKMRMKRLMARIGKKIARKAKRTKRTNPVSKRVAARNSTMRR